MVGGDVDPVLRPGNSSEEAWCGFSSHVFPFRGWVLFPSCPGDFVTPGRPRARIEIFDLYSGAFHSMCGTSVLHYPKRSAASSYRVDGTSFGECVASAMLT